MDRSEECQLPSYLDKTIKNSLTRKEQLRREGRTDESNFEQIKANVCAICRSIWQEGGHLYGGDQEGFARFFTQQLARMAAQWRRAHDTAAVHGDAEQVLIEDIKLAQIEDIRETFESNGR